jgi:inositol 1,4,5-triphosphate receptor type 1/inositol 1,4,5-triphosphate receptor type 3
VAFKYDSGLGGMMSPTFGTSLSHIIIRFIFDNTFNMLLLIIMLNIVAGIIIDTFGSLREELDIYTKDLENLCFICGFDKETIEKESNN